MNYTAILAENKLANTANTERMGLKSQIKILMLRARKKKCPDLSLVLYIFIKKKKHARVSILVKKFSDEIEEITLHRSTAHFSVRRIKNQF